MVRIAFLIFFIIGFSNLAQAQSQIEETQIASDSIYFQKSFIVYKYYQWDTRINFNQLPAIMIKDQEAYALVKKAKKNYTVAAISSGIGGFLLVLQLANAIVSGEPNWTITAVGGALVVVSIPIFSKSYKQSLKAIDKYNSGLGIRSHRVQLDLGTSKNGIGLIMSF